MERGRSPEVAVIIPTYNRRTVLAGAVESVLKQTHENFELIVVDDCSDDDTPSYLASISDARLRWHRFAERRRGNAARNHGAALSTAPILSFLDSDDRYLPDRLSDTLAFFAKHPDVGARISSFTSISGSVSTPRVNPEAIFSREDFERFLVGYCLYLGGSGITIRRETFDEIGGFDPTLTRMQDRELLLRIARNRGCASGAKIDWIKYRSADSLSHQEAGQLDALAALFHRHPVIAQDYPELFRYLAAREVVNPLIKGRIGHALAAYREARRNPDLAIRTFRLISDYRSGKRKRLTLRAEIFDRYNVRMD